MRAAFEDVIVIRGIWTAIARGTALELERVDDHGYPDRECHAKDDS